jgi:release factor glutamine methyltransferase
VPLLHRYRDLRLVVPPSVFAPRSDAGMLLDAVRAQASRRRGRALDLCSGSGVLAVSLARDGADVWAVDTSPLAALAVSLNARLNGVRVRVARGDLWRPLAGRRFDLVVCNPPYVPTPPGARRRPGSQAWEAGADGRLVLDPLCDGAAAHLEPGGELFLCQSSFAGAERTLERLRAGGLDADEVASHPGPLGPIAAERAGYLAERGLLASEQEGERIVVVRARRPA